MDKGHPEQADKSTTIPANSFAARIEAFAAPEPIEAVVIGEWGWGGGWRENEISRPSPAAREVVLPWPLARPMLDYEWDQDYGSPMCDAITLWTPTRVIFVSQYDGSTRLESVPRNPVSHSPDMPGG